MELKPGEVLLCEFYFSDFRTSKRRPVIVFKDNLPFEDFVGVPISSQITKLHEDEFILARLRLRPTSREVAPIDRGVARLSV